jgi:hypothetical protein
MKYRRTIRVTDVALALLVAGIVAIVVWLLVTSGSDDNPTPGTPKPSPTSVQTSPQVTQDDLSERYGKIGPLVDQFVQTYYYRDASSSQQKLVRQLSNQKNPLVTDVFLQTYLPSFSTESDEWVRQNNGVITATAYIPPTDVGIDMEHVTLAIEVTVEGEASGTKQPPYTMTVVLDLKWQDGRWLVDALN